MYFLSKALRHREKDCKNPTVATWGSMKCNVEKLFIAKWRGELVLSQISCSQLPAADLIWEVVNQSWGLVSAHPRTCRLFNFISTKIPF